MFDLGEIDLIVINLFISEDLGHLIVTRILIFIKGILLV